MKTIPHISERIQILLYLAFVVMIGVVSWFVWTATIQKRRAENQEARQALVRSDMRYVFPQRLQLTEKLHAETAAALTQEWETVMRENAFLFSPHDPRLGECEGHHDRIQAIYRLLEAAIHDRHRAGDIHAVTRMTPRPVIEHTSSPQGDVLFYEIPIQASLTMDPDKLDTLFNTPGAPSSLLLLRLIRITSGTPPEDTLRVSATFAALLLDGEEGSSGVQEFRSSE